MNILDFLAEETFKSSGFIATYLSDLTETQLARDVARIRRVNGFRSFFIFLSFVVNNSLKLNAKILLGEMATFICPMPQE